MADHQIPINLEIIVIGNHRRTAALGIDPVLVPHDAGLADHVPDLHGVIQSLAHVHHVKLVTVALSHQENRRAVLAPEVPAVSDPTQGPVQNLVQDLDSLVLSPVLVPNPIQDHPGTKHLGLLLGLLNREGRQLQIAQRKTMMTTLTVLQSNNKKVQRMKEEKTMLMIKQFKLSLDSRQPFIVISSFKYSLPGFVAVVEMVNFCCRARREWIGHSSVLGRDSKVIVCF